MSSYVLPRFLPKTHSGAVGVDFGDVRNFAKKPRALRANSHDGSQKGLKVFEIFKACRSFDVPEGTLVGQQRPARQFVAARKGSTGRSSPRDIPIVGGGDLKSARSSAPGTEKWHVAI
jgi:hypothetical protein